MKIGDLLRREFVVEELKASTKQEVLRELSDILARSIGGLDAGRTVEVLLEREKLGSTGIGDGIAIPHGKIPGLKDLVLSFGKSRGGIDFDAMDGRPVHLFFLLLAPEESAGLHLKALASISRLLKDAVFRQKLLAEASGDALFRHILDKDEDG